MAQYLKARLRRYRDARKPSAEPETDKRGAVETGSGASWAGWTEAGFRTLKREVFLELSVPLPGAFPAALPIIVPDILSVGKIPSAGDLLFFDLETTGLSGGAGTVAFLAAFGRFAKGGGKTRRNVRESARGNVCGSACENARENACGNARENACGNARVQITQYLLLDYPGESDFIERVLGEFASPPLVVTYNGKSFDSQILKTRCLMNGVPPPDYFHADLLHPARRLWKRVLPDCSQATVEVSVLGLNRDGDVPGAMAPEIWFSFLKSGDNSALLSICDHNVRDITGLATLFLALAEIAAEPFGSHERFRFDGEALALLWWKAIRKNPQIFGGKEKATGEALLRNAARNGSPLAALVLAKNAEWHLKDYRLALEYTDSALALTDISEELRENLLRRRLRLERKMLL